MIEFPDIDEIQDMLEEISETIPKDFFDRLNEGVVLLPERKLHSKSRRDRPLYVLGEYRKSITGSHIRIYYGSFKRVMEGFEIEEIKEKLRDTLLHEFTHHLETLAGERGLILKDQESLRKYLGK
ncbi:MAG: metallopeptidase family protein [Gudongella sp.]|jgi:predicted Zn-dependent protease with MMP-like domain|nr:metallopeptidase family protein [Gudongella sp.]